MELPPSLVANASYQTISLWFKTSTANSVLFSYQADPITNSTTTGNYTPALYVGSDGKLYGEFWFGTANPIVTSGTVTDGSWHQVVLTAGGDTQSMYLDNALVGSRSGSIQLINNSSSQHVYVGAGFIGGNWPSQSHFSSSDFAAYPTYFNGSVSDVAFLNQTLTTAAIDRIYSAGRNAAQLLTTVTRPTGNVSSQVVYDPATARVTQLTDSNNGIWKISNPVVSGSSQVYVSSALSGGPVDYYRMAETGTTRAVNQVNGHTATYNQVTLGTTGGPFDDATVASFNGTSSYLQLPDQDVPTTGPSSVSLWFKMPSGNTKGGVLFSYQAATIETSDTASGNWTPALYVGPTANSAASTGSAT